MRTLISPYQKPIRTLSKDSKKKKIPEEKHYGISGVKGKGKGKGKNISMNR